MSGDGVEFPASWMGRAHPRFKVVPAPYRQEQRMDCYIAVTARRDQSVIRFPQLGCIFPREERE